MGPRLERDLPPRLLLLLALAASAAVAHGASSRGLQQTSSAACVDGAPVLLPGLGAGTLSSPVGLPTSFNCTFVIGQAGAVVSLSNISLGGSGASTQFAAYGALFVFARQYALMMSQAK